MPRRHVGDKFNPLLRRLGFPLPPGQLMEIPHHKAAIEAAITGRAIATFEMLRLSDKEIDEQLVLLFRACHEARGELWFENRMHPPFWTAVKRRVEWCARVEWQQLREFTLTLTHASMLRMRRASAMVPEGQATPPTPSLVAAMRFSRDLIEYETHLRGRMDDLETDLKMWTAPAHLENGKMWRDSRGKPRMIPIEPVVFCAPPEPGNKYKTQQYMWDFTGDDEGFANKIRELMGETVVPRY